MKKSWMVMALLTFAMVVGPSMQAQAINREWSAVAGFLGGVLVANNAHYRQERRYSESRCYSAQPVYVQQSCPTYVVVQPPPGHYELQQRQVWVDGSWVYREVGCNTYEKVWQPGFYKTETVRVWVPGEVVCSTGYYR